MLAPRRQEPPVHLHLIEDPALMLQIVDPDRIRLHREEQRYSLRHLGELCECSHTQIRFYETGVTITITEKRARRLAQVLGFPLASVFRPTGGFVVPDTSNLPGDSVAGVVR